MRWLIAILVVGFSTVAGAAPGDGVVVESYSGQRPEDANRLLSPILDELATRGFVAGSDVVGRRFEQRVSRPSLIESGLPANFAQQVDDGHKAWIAGRFDDAVKVLTPLVDAAHANSGAFAQNQPLREKLLKALIALALSYRRIGDQDQTRATFGEILRSFPNTQLSRGQYGPDAFNLFEDVKKQALAGGRGKLVVKATDDTAVVFVNEQFQSAGGTAKLDLLPGQYRVFVQVGKQLSRVHRVNVVANDETVVTIDPEFDLLVRSSPKWTGFQFPDNASRERNESVFAAAFANAINANSVIVVGYDTFRGKPVIVASLVSLRNGRDLRRASINLDPDPSADKLRALAKFVAGDNTAPDFITVQEAGDVRDAAKGDDGQRIQIGDLGRRDSGGGRWGGWKWLTGGAGLAALGVGAYLLSVDGDCADDACTYFKDNTVSGWLTLGGGVALSGISVYLFLTASEESAPRRSAFIVPARGGAYAGYALRF